MSSPPSADRSSIEIKDLLRKLHPSSNNNHKDRIRRLNKFRNYVQPSNGGMTPEFYDDDIPLLFLGSETPAIYLDDENNDSADERRHFYGILQAAGMTSDNHSSTNNSSSHKEALKRSARQSMNLLKWLIMEWKEIPDNSGSGASIQSGGIYLNMFAKAFVSLPIQHYKYMNLHLHVCGDENDHRGGAKEDACLIISFILCHHRTETSDRLSPVLIEEFLPSPVAQQAYDLWSARTGNAHLTSAQQELLKKNTVQRQGEIAILQRQEAILQKQQKQLGGADHNRTISHASSGPVDADMDDDEHGHGDNSEHGPDDGDHHRQSTTKHIDQDGFYVDDDPNDNDEADEEDEEDDDDIDELDVMAAIRKRQKTIRKEMLAEGGHRGTINAVRWADSRLAREMAVRERTLNNQNYNNKNALTNNTVRDSADAIQEIQAREDEKAKILGKDPLGVYHSITEIAPNANIAVTANVTGGMNSNNNNEDYFDLRYFEARQGEQIETALQEIQEDIMKAEAMVVQSGSNAVAAEEILKKHILQKQSLEQLIESLGGLERIENNVSANGTATTSFTNHNTLASSNRSSILPTRPTFHPLLFLTILHRKTQYKDLLESTERLSSKTENQAEQLQNLVRDNFPLFVRCAEGFEEFRTSSETEVGLGVNERIEKLEAIAESAAYQAKKSFKPLLDNTSEVRKVQSALAVLQRVAPMLQVPALMRQHIENRRYSQALKTYRRSLVVDDTCRISLLTHVKRQAEDCVRDARRDLELRLTQDKATLQDLLDGIRDLSELLELDVPVLNKSSSSPDGGTENLEEKGIYEVDGTTINIREHPPALACLLLQAAHFSKSCKQLIAKAEDIVSRIFAGESLSSAHSVDLSVPTAETASTADESENTDQKAHSKALSTDQSKGSGNQWKYDVLDARVLSTIQAVDIVRIWLPRLVRVGRVAREEEKRRITRIGHRTTRGMKETFLTTFEVFVVNVAPSLTKLVEHTAFCSLGSNTRTGAKYVEMTFGINADEKLRTLLRSPLPPSQSTKVGKELASLVEVLDDCSEAIDDLRSENAMLNLSPLDTCKTLSDSAVITVEKRRCIYAFDVCARACSNRASGSGKFDADALIQCLQNLAEQLTRPEECTIEVEKGCELVVRRCCEGLASYVRDRGDDARLSAVAECADVIAEKVEDVIREVSVLTSKSQTVHDIILEDITGLEGAMFDEYLDSIRQNVANSVRFGWLDKDNLDVLTSDSDPNQPPSFPSYLSASLLAIVRCRAQVEQALGDRMRQTDKVPYQHLSMATVADGVVESICTEVMARKMKLKVRQADRLANELEFLNNVLKKFLAENTLILLDSTLHMVSSKAGRGRDYQGDGPDGLAALEELERLGRVYVLCLGD